MVFWVARYFGLLWGWCNIGLFCYTWGGVGVFEFCVGIS